MPKTTLVLKSSVTRRQADTVAPDINERLQQLQHHQAAEAIQAIDSVIDAASTTAPAPKTEPSGKQLKREAVAAQSAFLAGNLGKPISVFLINGIKLVGKLRQYDQYCILLEDQNGVSSLTFKHAICTVVPTGR